MTGKICMGGICGMGMAPLAAFLSDAGESVCGFDDFPNTEILSMLGEHGVELGKSADDFTDHYREFVISSALSEKAQNLPVRCARRLLRGEKWAEVCAPRKLVAVVGSHGKSTVSALISHAAAKTGLDCGWLVGAVPKGTAMHRYCGEGKLLFSEIDESDGTIEKFSPSVTVALNFDLDHTDTYGDDAELEGMFARIFARTTGAVVYPADDEKLGTIAGRFARRSFGAEAPKNFTERNAAMARAAFETATERALQPGVFSDFKGVVRRQETIADRPGFFAVADYAHHPNEVKTFLEWFAGRRPGRKLAVFQPHRYTRTKRFAKRFAEILAAAAADDFRIILLPVYPASEKFDPEGTSAAIAESAEGVELSEPGKIGAILESETKKGPLSLAVVGAGDFYFTAKELVSKL